MKIVFLMDPLENINFETDTTFVLMQAAHRRGHQTYFCAADGVALQDGHVSFHVEEVVAQPVKDQMFIRRGSVVLSDQDVDAVFIRLDPPFDQNYLNLTWMLDRLPARVKTINSPSGIRTANEKIWAAQFLDLVPPTLISRNHEAIAQFLSEHECVVVKPTDGHGGKNIFILQRGDANTNVILETVSSDWSREIVIQKYVPAADAGDKRILLLNGEPLGAVLRVHAPGDHRNNFCAGGRPVATELTGRDKEIIRTIKPELLRLGLTFVGIDVIGDYLIEVNVTSPTGIQEINRLSGTRLEDEIIAFLNIKTYGF